MGPSEVYPGEASASQRLLLPISLQSTGVKRGRESKRNDGERDRELLDSRWFDRYNSADCPGRHDSRLGDRNGRRGYGS